MNSFFVHASIFSFNKKIVTNKDKYRLLCQTEINIPIFSQAWWLDIVCGEKHWDVSLVEANDKILASMPYYQPRSNLIIMPSYTQTMGPWQITESTNSKYTTLLSKRQAFYKQLIEQLPRFDFFLQNFSYLVTDWLPFYWEGFRQTTRYTYILHNIKNHEMIWENMNSNLRGHITQASTKNGIIVKTGVPIDDFLSIQEKTFLRQNIKNKENQSTLRNLIEASRKRGQGEIWGGYDPNGQLHAAIFVVWENFSAYNLAAGGDPALRKSGAHSLILWEAIRYVSQYTDTFDFEGSMIPGVERFFREFGAIQTPFFTITKGKLSLLNRACLKIGRIINR